MQNRATVRFMWRQCEWVLERGWWRGLLLAARYIVRAASSGSNSQRVVYLNGSCLRLSQLSSSDDYRLGDVKRICLFRRFEANY